MRLIDADEIMERIGKLSLAWEYGQGVDDCIKIINNAPTVSDRYEEGYSQGYIDGMTGADMRGGAE